MAAPDAPGAAGITDAARRIDAALRLLAPVGVVVGAAIIDPADEVRLLVGDGAPVSAVARRRHEFASGRRLLRSLLGAEVAIPVREDRGPQLPGGWCGSLAHDDVFVVGAVASERLFQSIGVDLEPAVELEADVARIVVRDDEVGLDPTLVFALKEAAFKAWSSLGGRMLEHHEVLVRASDGRSESIVLDGELTIAGRYAMVGERWLALATVPSTTADG